VAGEDRQYILWLGSLPCAVPGCHNQPGPPHHPRHDVAMSRRAHDHRAVNLCHEHHEQAQTYQLLGMDKYQLREWLDEVAAKRRAEYLNNDQGAMKCE
jgi:hypothetical protein